MRNIATAAIFPMSFVSFRESQVKEYDIWTYGFQDDSVGPGRPGDLGGKVFAPIRRDWRRAQTRSHIQLDECHDGPGAGADRAESGREDRAFPASRLEAARGEETRLSVTLEGRLAESLEKMLNNFFMRYAMGSDADGLPPAELKHIIGRPTAAELKLLKRIYEGKMWATLPAEKGGFRSGMLQATLKMFAGEIGGGHASRGDAAKDRKGHAEDGGQQDVPSRRQRHDPNSEPRGRP